MRYTINQWVLFFFFYSFCGWVWESCFVSVRKRRWVNRGFLHGPILPIYGFGALIILLSTLPVRKQIPLIYIVGMAAATALEYATGAVMEALFHVRYWDYSDKPLNVNGHICLLCSLGWGAFSVLLVQYAHPLVERLCLSVSPFFAQPLAWGLSIGAVADAVLSFRAAMDMRGLLMRMTAENERLGQLAKRMEAHAATAQAEWKQRKEMSEAEKRLGAAHPEAAFLKKEENLAARRRTLRILRGNPSATARRYGGAMRMLRRLNETKSKHKNAKKEESA